MSILPEGEQLRKAIRWISAQRTENPEIAMSELIGNACLRFDLSPKDADLVVRFFAEQTEQE